MTNGLYFYLCFSGLCTIMKDTGNNSHKQNPPDIHDRQTSNFICSSLLHETLNKIMDNVKSPVSAMDGTSVGGIKKLPETTELEEAINQPANLNTVHEACNSLECDQCNDYINSNDLENHQRPLILDAKNRAKEALKQKMAKANLLYDEMAELQSIIGEELPDSPKSVSMLDQSVNTIFVKKSPEIIDISSDEETVRESHKTIKSSVNLFNVTDEADLPIFPAFSNQLDNPASLLPPDAYSTPKPEKLPFVSNRVTITKIADKSAPNFQAEHITVTPDFLIPEDDIFDFGDSSNETKLPPNVEKQKPSPKFSNMKSKPRSNPNFVKKVLTFADPLVSDSQDSAMGASIVSGKLSSPNPTNKQKLNMVKFTSPNGSTHFGAHISTPNKTLTVEDTTSEDEIEVIENVIHTKPGNKKTRLREKHPNIPSKKTRLSTKDDDTQSLLSEVNNIFFNPQNSNNQEGFKSVLRGLISASSSSKPGSAPSISIVVNNMNSHVHTQHSTTQIEQTLPGTPNFNPLPGTSSSTPNTNLSLIQHPDPHGAPVVRCNLLDCSTIKKHSGYEDLAYKAIKSTL